MLCILKFCFDAFSHQTQICQLHVSRETIWNSKLSGSKVYGIEQDSVSRSVSFLTAMRHSSIIQGIMEKKEGVLCS